MLERTLPSDAKCLPDVREDVRVWAADRGWSEHQIGEIALALDEALSNVIRHGYNGRDDGKMELKVAEYAEDGVEGVEIRVRDYCDDVQLEKICGRDLDDVRPGGLGVHLIYAMMESVKYEHAPGGGLLLIMRKSKNHTAGETEGRQR